MRILQLAASFAYTGPAEPMLSLSTALARQGHQVTVGHDTVRPDGNAHEEGIGPRVQQTGLPVAQDLRLCTREGPWAWWKDMRALRERMKELDVIHVHFSHDHVIAAGARMGARRPVLVRTVHSDRSLRPRPLQGRLLRTSDAVVVHSRQAAEQARALGVAADRVHVIHGTVDHRRFHSAEREKRRQSFRARHGLPDGVPAVAMVAIFQEGRGQQLLLDAWSDVAEQLGDTELWFAGLGEERAAVMHACEQRGIKRVRFLGYLKEDLPDVYAAVDATVILAVGNDGFGRSALESLASGTPVIAGAHPPLVEAIQEAGAGLLVPPADRAALATALVRMLGMEPGQRALMGQRGRQRVEQHHSQERVVEQTLDLYSRLLATGPA